jgi:hypothetical protein
VNLAATHSFSWRMPEKIAMVGKVSVFSKKISSWRQQKKPVLQVQRFFHKKIRPTLAL